MIVFYFTGSYEVNSLNPRFVGSVEASINNYPYQLSIYFGHNNVCGATIIAPKWAITSAYCLEWTIPQMLNLRAGSNETQRGGTIYKVSNFVIHPKYNGYSEGYDVALLNLTTPFVYGKTIRSIPIIQANKNIAPGTSTIITGWGYVSNTGPSFSHTLRKIVLPIIEPSLCRNEYGSKFNQNIMLCTGYEKYKKNLCSLSGFPLVVNDTLIGIFSTGHGCTIAPNINTKFSAQSIQNLKLI